MGQRPRRPLGAVFRSEVRPAEFDKESVGALRRELRRIRCTLSEQAFAQLIAELESDVTDYWWIQQLPARIESAEALERMVAAAHRFEQARHELEGALAALDGRAAAELADSHLGVDHVRGARARVQATIRRRPDFVTLEQAARDATKRLRTPGRPRDVRRNDLAVMVAQALTRIGVRPSVYDSGTLATFVRVVFKVAKVKVPEDLIPLLKHAVACVNRVAFRVKTTSLPF